MADAPYNPLDKRNLGESVAKALLERPVGPLPPQNSFLGAGVYAIYYAGNLGLYEPIAKANKSGRYEKPIYVGKAVPPGARKGGFGLGLAPGAALFGRLNQHAKSIEQVDSLDLTDFSCRYLVADDIWIPLGESLLIHRFQPLWNILIEGFGNHDPGKGRYQQQKSPWDVLHPGRSWANLLQTSTKSSDEVEDLVQDFFSGKPVPKISPERAIIDEEEE